MTLLIPKVVQDMIEYTKLKKKYPNKDKGLRIDYNFKDITTKQMYVLLKALREFDKAHTKSKPLRCEQCGKKMEYVKE